MTERPGLPFIGLTGSIGAGKSTALAALERLGAATLSADAVAHEVLASPEVVALVEERLGPEVVRDGTLDRTAVAQRVFVDEDARKWLESTVWPRVGQRMWEWRQQQEVAEPRPRLLVVEVPLLFESDMDQAFDATIVITADEVIRHGRIAARGHAANAEREARQMPQAEKVARADFAVANDGTRGDLERKLSAVVEQLTTA